MRELEVQVTKWEALESTVADLLARQLGATRRVLSAAPPIHKLRCRFACAGLGSSLLLAAALLACAAVVSFGGSLFVAGLGLAIASALYNLVMRVEFAFDGRWLRITRLLFGVRYLFTRTVDLARFNKVELTNFEVSNKDSAPTLRTRVELHTLAGGIELATAKPLAR